MDIRGDTFKATMIISAFKKSGIWPINQASFNDEDFAPSLPFSTQAQDFPSLLPLPLLPPLSNVHHGSDSDSDLDSDLDTDFNDTGSPPPLPAPYPITSLSQPTLPTALPTPIPSQQFYCDPTLYSHILQLKEQVQQLSGHVKMMEVELQNEKRWNNQQDQRASKQQKLNVEVQVLTSEEGKQLAAEKEAEKASKDQKKKDTEIR